MFVFQVNDNEEKSRVVIGTGTEKKTGKEYVMVVDIAFGVDTNRLEHVLNKYENAKNEGEMKIWAGQLKTEFGPQVLEPTIKLYIEDGKNLPIGTRMTEKEYAGKFASQLGKIEVAKSEAGFTTAEDLYNKRLKENPEWKVTTTIGKNESVEVRIPPKSEYGVKLNNCTVKSEADLVNMYTPTMNTQLRLANKGEKPIKEQAEPVIKEYYKACSEYKDTGNAAAFKAATAKFEKEYSSLVNPSTPGGNKKYAESIGKEISALPVTVLEIQKMVKADPQNFCNNNKAVIQKEMPDPVRKVAGEPYSPKIGAEAVPKGYSDFGLKTKPLFVPIEQKAKTKTGMPG